MTLIVETAANSLGERVRVLRSVRGLSAQKLSDAVGCGLTRGVIANLESGRKHDITVSQLVALCRALNVDARSLVPDLPVGE